MGALTRTIERRGEYVSNHQLVAEFMSPSPVAAQSLGCRLRHGESPGVKVVEQLGFARSQREKVAQGHPIYFEHFHFLDNCFGHAVRRRFESLSIAHGPDAIALLQMRFVELASVKALASKRMNSQAAAFFGLTPDPRWRRFNRMR
jgi:hypothetical protein